MAVPKFEIEALERAPFTQPLVQVQDQEGTPADATWTLTLYVRHLHRSELVMDSGLSVEVDNGIVSLSGDGPERTYRFAVLAAAPDEEGQYVAHGLVIPVQMP